MNGQIKNTLIQILIGSAIVVGGLVMMNKFLPNFTLFPGTAKMPDETIEASQSPNNLEQAKPEGEDDNSTLPDQIMKPSTSFGDEDEEESSVRTNQAPEGVTANQVYSLDKRLRAGSLAMITPLEVLKNSKRSYTNSLINEVCPNNVKNYHKDFSLYFTMLDDKLAESILFLAVNINKSTFVFKPQKGNNRLIIPNNLKVGRHQVTFGYYLKKDADKDEIPYYASTRNCMITVSK